MSECEKLIQFDTTIIQNGLVSRYTLFSYINRENYEQMKQSYSASIAEYFAGGYDDFKQRRSELTSLFVSSGFNEQSQNYFHHGLSRESAQSYAICVANTSHKPISVWVDSFGENTVSIVFRSGLPDGVRLEYTVIGAEAILDATGKPQKFGVLSGTSQEAATFRYDSKKKFNLVVNAVIGKGKDSASIDIPPVKNYVAKSEVQFIEGTIWCAAGGDGSLTGSYGWGDAELVAPAGFHLLPETLAEVSRVETAPGIRVFQVTPTSNADRLVSRIVLHPHDHVGNNKDTQGKISVTYRVTAEKKYLVEV